MSRGCAIIFSACNRLPRQSLSLLCETRYDCGEDSRGPLETSSFEAPLGDEEHTQAAARAPRPVPTLRFSPSSRNNAGANKPRTGAAALARFTPRFPPLGRLGSRLVRVVSLRFRSGGYASHGTYPAPLAAGQDRGFRLCARSRPLGAQRTSEPTN